MKPLTSTIQPVLVRDSAVHMLRNAIITGELKSGARLIERELCEALGVSRGSVREVIRQLEAERLITVEPRKGPMVATLTAKQVSDIFEVRMMLEGHIAQRFTKVADDSQIENLREIYKKYCKATDDRDRLALVTLIGDFYDYMAEVVDNEAIRDTLQLLNARIASLRTKATNASGRIDAGRIEVQDIFEAIVARKPRQAAKATEIHVQAACAAALTQVTT